MKFMNKITEKRYSFMYVLKKNEKNIQESPKFGNAHTQFIRMEKSTGQIWVEVWFGLVWVTIPLESSGENIFCFFVVVFLLRFSVKTKLRNKIYR